MSRDRMYMEARISAISDSVLRNFRNEDCSSPSIRLKVLEMLKYEMKSFIEKNNLFSTVMIAKDINTLVISDEDDYYLLSLLPYVHEFLQNTDEVFLVYWREGNNIMLDTAITFVNLFTKAGEDDFGFIIEDFEVKTLGVYFPKENVFIKESDL